MTKPNIPNTIFKCKGRHSKATLHLENSKGESLVSTRFNSECVEQYDTIEDIKNYTYDVALDLCKLYQWQQNSAGAFGKDKL